MLREIFEGLLEFSDALGEVIASAFEKLKSFLRKVITGILSFAREVVGYFRNLRLDRDKHTPFLANAEAFKEQLKTARVKNVGIFEGVYNEETDEIESARYLDADEVDQRTEDVLGDEALVVLQ